MIRTGSLSGQEDEIEYQRLFSISACAGCAAYFRQPRRFAAGILGVFQGKTTQYGGK